MKKVNIPNSSKILYSNIIASLDCLSLIKFNMEVDRMIQIRGNNDSWFLLQYIYGGREDWL